MPTVNAFLGSVRWECLDHLLILHEQQLSRVLQTYATYFNKGEQGIPGLQSWGGIAARNT